MDSSIVASENTKGRFIIDGGQELLHKRLANIQKQKADIRFQEQKTQYIDALISLAKSKFDISKEDLCTMTVPEFNALNKRIHNNASKARLRSNIKMSMGFFTFFIMIGIPIYALVMESWISMLFFFVLLIVLIIVINNLPDDDKNYFVIMDNEKFVEEILPSDIQ